jgi:hypothetical protein
MLVQEEKEFFDFRLMKGVLVGNLLITWFIHSLLNFEGLASEKLNSQLQSNFVKRDTTKRYWVHLNFCSK